MWDLRIDTILVNVWILDFRIYEYLEYLGYYNKVASIEVEIEFRVYALLLLSQLSTVILIYIRPFVFYM